MVQDVTSSTTLKDSIECYIKEIVWKKNNCYVFTADKYKSKVKWDFWNFELKNSNIADYKFYFYGAKNGDAQGQSDLGMMYLNGQIVFKDIEKVKYWLKKSAEQNYRRAQDKLNSIPC